jgi:(R)-2-hydroxyacyl-CoA dehydratese activating ATPase
VSGQDSGENNIMIYTAGIDVGSTYTKAIIVNGDRQIAGHGLVKTGFKLHEAGDRALQVALSEAGLRLEDIAYTASTGYGRFQTPSRNVTVTDLTANARGARFLYPNTNTILDVGGQTMKASRLDAVGKVKSFRLNDKCAAGTGAFLEKTARYMGFNTEEIGPLAATSKSVVAISGVCAVFAESEVINCLSQGNAPADIMQGAIVSLVDRSVQLMRRVQMEPEFTLVGGILRFESMARVVQEKLRMNLNVPEGDLVQFVAALGAALLAQKRLHKLGDQVAAVEIERPVGALSGSYTGS